MQLKHTFVALAAAGLLSTQAYASEAQIEAAIQPAQPVAAFTDADLFALFGQDAQKPMQLAALSPQEMKETEGAVLPLLFIAGSAALSAWGYHGINYYNTGSIGSASGAAKAAAYGALAVTAPMTRILGPYKNTGGFGVALARPFSDPYKNANQFGRIDFHKNSHSGFVHTHRGRWGR
jgi:hypothetical protein